MSPLSKAQGFWREGPSEGADEAELLECSPSSPTRNVVAGPVVAMYRGFTRTGIRMRVGERTDLRVKWPSDEGAVSGVKIGQWVIATIPAEAVRCEAGEFQAGEESVESVDRPNRLCGAGENGTVDHGEDSRGELDAEEYWPGRGLEPTS